jgi:general secretion pathway protein D
MGLNFSRSVVLFCGLLLAACADEAAAPAEPTLFDELGTRSLAPQPALPGRFDVIAAGAGAAPAGRVQLFPGNPPPPPPIGATVAPGTAIEGAQLNFNNADLRQVVQVVLGEILKRPYAIDPAVQGSVTLTSSGPLAATDLLAALETALRSNGAALVDRGAAGVQIVPLGSPILGGQTVVQLGGDTRPIPPGYGISIVPLRNVTGEALAPLLAPLANPEMVRVDPERNLVVVAGTSSERASLVQTIGSLDMDAMRGRSAGIFPLKLASPDRMIRELQAVFQGAPDRGPLKGLIQFLPMERLNAVLVVTASPERLREAADWVRRLDQGDNEDEQIYVYFVQNGKARDLANTLNQLFGKPDKSQDEQAGTARDTPAELAAPALGPTTTATGEAAAPADGAGEAQALSFDEAPTDAEASIMGLADTLASGSAFELDRFGPVRVVPDKEKNALVIRARPAAFRLIEQALRSIDAAPLQVMIEATIAEVTLNDTLRYGVQFFLDSGNYSAGLTQSATSIVPQAVVPGLNLLYAAGNSRVVLDALSSITNVRVVSAPSLSVLNNQTARLQVGDQVPVITRQSQSVDDPDAPIVNNVEYRDTGVILRVTPRINSAGEVSMDVQQEVSSVTNDSTTNASSLAPTISTRRIGSVVQVVSGQTVVLGGLISETQTNGRSGIPGLVDVPVLGALFGSDSNKQVRTELVVFITPRVIRNPAEAQAIAEEMRGRIRALRPLPVTQ